MSCHFARRHAANDGSNYASGEDCRKLFTRDVNSLYLLSLLLTADHKKAEQCFLAGLDDCINGSPVHQEWAHSWARRLIIRNAIRMMAPRCAAAAPIPGPLHSAGSDHLPKMPMEFVSFAPVFCLEHFERFVYVLSVLERYSEQDCAALLGTSPWEIRKARVRAFEKIADCERPVAVPANKFQENRESVDDCPRGCRASHPSRAGWSSQSGNAGDGMLQTRAFGIREQWS